MKDMKTDHNKDDKKGHAKDHHRDNDKDSHKKAFSINKVHSIPLLKAGDYFEGTVKILRKVKPGPTILVVTDSQGAIDAVAKDCIFEVDDVVELKGPVSERAGRLQIEIKSVERSSKDFDALLEEKSNPPDRQLSISSERLSKLRPHFLNVAKIIRKAMINNQPVLIRHHADADGIIAGMSIEKACSLFIEEVGMNPQHYIFRSPSKAPFYETTDVLKDISFTKKVIEGHDQKKPLILVLDNGSTPEDVFAMKTLKTMGFDIIVVDHHNPVVLENNKTAVCPYLLYHINPYIHGMDSQTSAGMLCYEIARLIHEDFEQPLFPAVSGVGDRCEIPEIDLYISNAGMSKEKIRELVIAIDFLAYNLRFDSGQGVYEEVFQNEEFVRMINEKVNQGVETQLQSTLPYLRTQEINGVVFSHIDLEKYTLRFTYPTPGKIIGLIHDKVSVGKENAPVFTIGYLSDMVIIRATKPILPVAKIIEALHKDIPEANVDGGGHECAGTIKFVSAHLSTIIEYIKNMVRAIDYSQMATEIEDKE